MGQRAAGKEKMDASSRTTPDHGLEARFFKTLLCPLPDALYGRVLFNPTNVPPFLWQMIRMRVA
jgi:hypothetical protein